jgi:HD-GYP domain-containing protein (c-di-GMP phosphodiesterase class II)
VLLAQIVTVADVFDALTTDRPYRKAMTRRMALAVMREEARDGAYEPELVERLATLQRRRPTAKRALRPARAALTASVAWGTA